MSFKKRMLQVKVAWGIIGLLVILGLEVFLLPRNATSNANLVYEGIPWIQSLPWISIVLVVMAIRGIHKDEKLVKSADRLR